MQESEPKAKEKTVDPKKKTMLIQLLKKKR